MNRSQRFFRCLWRVNAVLILVAAGAITLGIGLLLFQEFGRVARSHDEQTGIPVAGPSSKTQLSLGRASLVPGTNVMQAQLLEHRAGTGFSSGDYNETRNIMFIEPGDKAARWLLPDNNHVIAETFEVADDNESVRKHVLATVVLVKLETDSSEGGQILLFDPAGRHIVQVASSCRQVHLAALSDGALTILYERDRHLVIATFDPTSIAKRQEEVIDVPQLN